MLLLTLLACDDRGPSWHRDISPLMQQHCARCHSEGGQGPGDYSTYEAVVELSPQILEAIREGRMPPPTTDPDCRDFHGSDFMVFDEGELGLLETWVDHGFREGRLEDAPEVEAPSTELVDPDLELFIEPYTPTFTDEDNPDNEYRCFLLDHGGDETVYLNAMAPLVDNDDIVHHIVLFSAYEDELPADDDEGPGWDCIDDVFIGGSDAESFLAGNGMVAGWGPGALPVELPEGVGLRLSPSQRLVLQVHYYRPGPEADGRVDQTGYAFRLVEDVHTQVFMAPMGVYGFDIPAGEPAHTETQAFVLPVGATVHAVFPHMHVLGTGYELTASLDGEETCVARSERYDFDNQLSYVFKDDVSIPEGSLVSMSCTWDNSADNPEQLYDPPRDIGYGERTDEEMCFGFSLVSLGD
jgi:hypothetical protein